MNKYLYMTEEGYEFSDSDCKKLATYLGILRKRKILIDLIICIITLCIILPLTICLICKYTGFWFVIIPIFLCIVEFFICDVKKYDLRQKKYLDTVKNVYVDKAKEYEGYNLEIVGYNPDVTSVIYEKSLLMATDKYKFIFMSDPFVPTPYKFNDGSTLKVMSNYMLNESSFEFMISDIKSYSLEPDKDIKEYQLENSFYDIESCQKLVVILNDFTKYEFSANLYKYLHEGIPTREVKYE